MEEVFRRKLASVSISRKSVLFLGNFLRNVGDRIMEAEEGAAPQITYATLKHRIHTKFPRDLAVEALAYAKSCIARKQYYLQKVYPHATKTANILCCLVWDYLIQEIIDLAAASPPKTRRIEPRHVRMAILHDQDLRQIAENPTVLFFWNGSRDPYMGNLWACPFGVKTTTSQCACTALVRRKGECSLEHDDDQVRLQYGPFRMYSVYKKNRVVAFLLLADNQQADGSVELHYGFHKKCFGIFKRLVRQLQRCCPSPIMARVVTSERVAAFLKCQGLGPDSLEVASPRRELGVEDVGRNQASMDVIPREHVA